MKGKSFVIQRKDLTPMQEDRIVNHIEAAKKIGWTNCEFYKEWVIEFTNDDVFGCTFFETPFDTEFFDMELFLVDNMGINPNIITWGDGI